MLMEKYRDDFPVLKEKIGNKQLIYFDNAATTLKPQIVIDAVSDYYAHHCANIHRGVHTLSERATELFESSRIKMQEFIHAKYSHEVIFTKGTTESINLVANSLSDLNLLQEGDEVLLTRMEHHSNIVPWMLIAKKKKIIIKVANLNSNGEVDWEDWESHLSHKTKVVAMTAISNTLGTINPIKDKIAKAHEFGALVLIDAAQAPLHMIIDVQDLDCDFLALSGHKMLAPTGVGILYGKEELLNKMPPYQGGGDMIKHVSFEKILYADLPHKFEAGTPPIASVIGLGKAIDYINKINVSKISSYTHELTSYLIKEIHKLSGVKIIGPNTDVNRSSSVSFVMDEIHPHDIGTIANEAGIALRTGHHCTYPIMEYFNIPATTRASLSFYNTKDEVDQLIISLIKIQGMFQ